MDLHGKIVFKVKLGDEIKKIVIHNEEINFNELLLMMQRIFADKIKANDEFSMKYTDEENDLVTMANDSDVSLALENSKILKLTLFLKEVEQDREPLKANEIVSELQHIRTSIDKFLHKFEQSLKFEPKPDKSESAPQHTSIINKESHKEFDPLTKMPEFNRPDSTSSLELSNSQKNFDNLKQQHTIAQPQPQMPQQNVYQPQMPQKNTQQPQMPQQNTQQPQMPQQNTQQPQMPQQNTQQPQMPQQNTQQPQMPQQHTQQPKPPTNQQQTYPQQQQQAQIRPDQNFNPQQQSQGQQQQYYQAPTQMYSPQQQQQPNAAMNPYAKPPTTSAQARPPSATQFYHQGYK